MIRLIKRILFFSLPVVIVLLLIEYSLRNIPNDYSYKDHYLKTKSENIQVLYLGNSHIYFGINPAFSKFKAFNAAATSQTLDIDLKILQNYKNWKSLKSIVIPIDYISMYFKLENRMDSWRMKNYVIYYGFPSKHIVNHFELFNGKFAANSKRFINYHVNGKTNVECNKFGFGLSYNHIKSEDINKTAISAAQRHTIELNDDKYISNFEYNKKVVNQFIQFAKLHKIKIYLVSPPVSHKYSSLIDNEQLNNTIKYIESVMQKNNKYCSYINLTNDIDFNNSDFYDGDHLNEIGAKKFTKKMDEYFDNDF